MGEGTKAPISDQDVSELEDRMKEFNVSHIVGSQRSCQRTEQQPRAGVKENQDAGHGKPTSGLLISRLTEPGLEFGRIGHGKRRAICEEGAMTT